MVQADHGAWGRVGNPSYVGATLARNQKSKIENPKSTDGLESRCALAQGPSGIGQ
jgi:hypothetical protein